jgi:hypothetical protein
MKLSYLDAIAGCISLAARWFGASWLNSFMVAFSLKVLLSAARYIKHYINARRKLSKYSPLRQPGNRSHTPPYTWRILLIAMALLRILSWLAPVIRPVLNFVLSSLAKKTMFSTPVGKIVYHNGRKQDCHVPEDKPVMLPKIVPKPPAQKYTSMLHYSCRPQDPHNFVASAKILSDIKGPSDRVKKLRCWDRLGNQISWE